MDGRRAHGLGGLIWNENRLVRGAWQAIHIGGKAREVRAQDRGAGKSAGPLPTVWQPMAHQEAATEPSRDAWHWQAAPASPVPRG